MNKVWLVVLALCLMAPNVWALELSFTIPAGKVMEYVSDFVYVHENNETKSNPAYVDKATTPNELQEIAKYATDGAWVREHLRRYIVSQIKRGKNAKARDAYLPSVVDDIE